MRDRGPVRAARTLINHCRQRLLARQLALIVGLTVATLALRAPGQYLALGDEGASTADYALSPLTDAGVLPCSYSGYSDGCNAGGGRATQPASWIGGPYFKSGLSFVMGKGLLVDSLKTGYSISGGARQPFAFELGGDQTFLDLGGSYMSAFGRTERDTDRIDVFVDDPTMAGTPVPPSVVVPDGLETTLTQVQRAGAHMGIGRMWGSPIDQRSEDPQLAFATIVGGRVSHIHGRFNEQVIGSLTPPPAGATGTTFRRGYSQTDTAGGLYANAQAILLRRNSELGCMQMTLDAEFAHDWVNLKGFENRGLATATIFFGVMFSR